MGLQNFSFLITINSKQVWKLPEVYKGQLFLTVHPLPSALPWRSSSENILSSLKLGKLVPPTTAQQLQIQFNTFQHSPVIYKTFTSLVCITFFLFKIFWINQTATSSLINCNKNIINNDFIYLNN